MITKYDISQSDLNKIQRKFPNVKRKRFVDIMMTYVIGQFNGQTIRTLELLFNLQVSTVPMKLNSSGSLHNQ